MSEAELSKIHKLIHQPSYALIYPETEMELGYPVARRILEYIQAQKAEWEREARQSELEMFKKIPIDKMSREVTGHISRRYAELSKEQI